jgi:hypothetical protein
MVVVVVVVVGVVCPWGEWMMASEDPMKTEGVYG